MFDKLASFCLKCMFKFPMLTQTSLGLLAAHKSLRLSRHGNCWDIASKERAIRLANNHQQYIPNIISNFDYYYSSVKPNLRGDISLIDFSKSNNHEVIGYPQQKFLFQSIVEPIGTALQYLDLANLKPGDTVLDLGAYSGFTSILFDQAVASSGRVIAVDADPLNSACVRKNLSRYKSRTGRNIEFICAAVWKNSGAVEFASEGSVGSYVQEIKGYARGHSNGALAMTLSDIAGQFNLPRIDFIKCDIEGAEAAIFDKPEFFSRFRPRIVIEVHRVGGALTTARCRKALARYGYTFQEFAQIGSDLPLLQCLPQEQAGLCDTMGSSAVV